MARTKFATLEAMIVISTAGYFDVYPSGDRVANVEARLSRDHRPARPRRPDRQPARRFGPNSIALRVAVASWSSEHGAAAVRGELGAGRNGKQVVPAA